MTGLDVVVPRTGIMRVFVCVVCLRASPLKRHVRKERREHDSDSRSAKPDSGQRTIVLMELRCSPHLPALLLPSSSSSSLSLAQA